MRALKYWQSPAPSWGSTRDSTPRLFHLLVVAGIPWLEATSLQCSKVRSPSPLCVSKLTLPLPYSILVIAFRTPWDNPGWIPHLKILNLIISARILFPNKVMFICSRNLTLFRDLFSALHTGSRSHSRTWCEHSDVWFVDLEFMFFLLYVLSPIRLCDLSSLPLFTPQSPLGPPFLRVVQVFYSSNSRILSRVWTDHWQISSCTFGFLSTTQSTFWV